MDEIARLEALGGAEINEAKKVLATEATALMHGREAAEAAAATASETFEKGGMAEGLPTVEIAGAEISAGLGLLTAMVKAGLAASNGEARRAVDGGAVRINDKPVSDPRHGLTEADLTPEGLIKLSMGKKRHVLLKAV